MEVSWEHGKLKRRIENIVEKKHRDRNLKLWLAVADM